MCNKKRIKVLGVNDDRDFCECCGKIGIKRVVWITIDDGEPKHYGTACAAKIAGIDGKWSAKRADILASKLKEREERMRRREALRECAQAEANRSGQPTYLGYTGSGIYRRGEITWFTHAHRVRVESTAQEWVDIWETCTPA
jgi:hypothetical protein